MTDERYWWRAKYVRDSAGVCWGEVLVRASGADEARRLMNRGLGWHAVEQVMRPEREPVGLQCLGEQAEKALRGEAVLGLRDGNWAALPVIRRRGRLPLAPVPSTAAQRVAKARGRHLQQGGATLSVVLSKPARDALVQLAESEGKSQRAIVEQLLLREVGSAQ